MSDIPQLISQIHLFQTLILNYHQIGNPWMMFYSIELYPNNSRMRLVIDECQKWNCGL